MIKSSNARNHGHMTKYFSTSDLPQAGIPSTDQVFRYSANNAYTDAGGTTLCSVGGVDTCYVLKDSSINANHLTQSTAGFRPLWISSAINGLPALRFDGVDDFLTNGVGRTHPNSNYIVVNILTDTGNDYGIFDGGAANECELVEDIGGNIRLYSAGYTGTVTPGLAAYGVVCAVSDGINSLVSLNGGADQVGTLGATAITGTTLGAAGSGVFFTNIEVAEWISYDIAHTPTQRAAIITELRTKYGL